ncbi:EAL domain-containing protein [Chromobacterium paludis]|uniref:Diguanylate cyclase DosC n=1 Tax=Chromobacterium paludis TaxID=2605945 RepID=A0A5C1DFC7_9NEIS|nr:EAL domain-containing protein [Chromobacterium paludis]QEL55233.1 EAL domain-containing protein [Chromobacterium paludis]
MIQRWMRAEGRNRRKSAQNVKMQTDDKALLAGMCRLIGIRADHLALLPRYAELCLARREVLAKELYWHLLKSECEAESLKQRAGSLEAVVERLLQEWESLLRLPLDEARAWQLSLAGETWCRMGIGLGWLAGLYERVQAHLLASLAQAPMAQDDAVEAARLLRKRILLDQMLKTHGYQRALQQESLTRQQHLQSISALYSTLSGVTLALADSVDRRIMLQSVCDVCVQESAFNIAWVGMLAGDELQMSAMAHQGWQMPGEEMFAFVRLDEGHEANPVARALRGRVLQVSNDVRGDPHLHGWREGLGALADGSLLVAPLLVRQHVVGVLVLHSRHRHFFDQTRLALFDVMTREIGRALERHEAMERSQRIETELDFLSRHDVLTGLPNRSQMQDLIGRLLRARHGGSQVAVLAVAVEGFHEINARLGYDGGDMVLCEMARRLRDAIYPFGHVGRVGASRFIVCTERVDRSQELVDAVLRQLPLPVEVMAVTVEARCSVGVAVSPAGPCDPASLLRRANLALNRAKEQGGGHYRHYDAALDEEIHRLHAMRSAFAMAVPRGELRLYFQPKINLQTNRIEGAEALVRWVRDGRYMLPGEFFPAIENSGLMRELDWWVLREAVRQACEWRNQGQIIPVSVNLSAATLKHDDFLPALSALLETHPLPSGFLELEVLESVTQQEAEQITPKLERCRDLGLSIALDDFGTGASSLVHLQQLPFDTIKIDQRFVRLLLDMPGNEAIIRSMLSFAHYTGRKLVVEGVESRAIWQRLQEIGCHDGQGYGISPPLAAHELPGWVRDWNVSGADVRVINSAYVS